MPRYYFNFTNGERFMEDAEGIDLPDEVAVREEALGVARDLSRESLDGVDGVDAWFAWRIEITDENGRLVMTIPFSATDEPS